MDTAPEAMATVMVGLQAEDEERAEEGSDTLRQEKEEQGKIGPRGTDAAARDSKHKHLPGPLDNRRLGGSAAAVGKVGPVHRAASTCRLDFKDKKRFVEYVAAEDKNSAECGQLAHRNSKRRRDFAAKASEAGLVDHAGHMDIDESNGRVGDEAAAGNKGSKETSAEGDNMELVHKVVPVEAVPIDKKDPRDKSGVQPAELLADAIAFKKEGNTEFQRNDLQKAMHKYRRAYECIGDIGRSVNDCTSPEIISETHKELTALLGNLALARLKEGEGREERSDQEGARRQYRNVLGLTEQILQNDSGNLKALYRRALAAAKLGEKVVAYQTIARARQIAPQDRDIGNLENQLQTRFGSEV